MIEIASTPAIAGDTASAPSSVAKFRMIATTKHVALEHSNKNNQVYTLALGIISTGATFTSLTLTERKKEAMGNSMNVWGDSRELAGIGASMVSEDFAFAIIKKIVIDEDTVML